MFLKWLRHYNTEFTAALTMEPNHNITIEKVKSYWDKQGLTVMPASKKEMKQVLKSIPLPVHFQQLYATANGMKDCDEEGFVFYSIEDIVSLETKFNMSHRNRNIYIFADYLQSSWWYGFRVYENGTYEVGIIPYEDKFKPITNSLFDFLELYLADSSPLYDCEY